MFLFKKKYDFVALADGHFLDLKEVSDPMFKREMLGETLAMHLEGKEIYAPLNGKLEVMFPTGHAFAIRSEDGTAFLIHIGIDTVKMQGAPFKIFKKQGEEVKQGEKILEVDWQAIKELGYDCTTFVVISERGSYNYEFRKVGTFRKGKSICL